MMWLIWGEDVPWDYAPVDYRMVYMMCCEIDDDVVLSSMLMQQSVDTAAEAVVTEMIAGA